MQTVLMDHTVVATGLSLKQDHQDVKDVLAYIDQANARPAMAVPAVAVPPAMMYSSLNFIDHKHD